MGVEADQIDGSEAGVLATAQTAMVELWDAFAKLNMSALIAKPVDNGAKPVIVRENGVDVEVDPGQVSPESRAARDLRSETDPAIVPEALKLQRAKAALDDAAVPDELRPSHLRNDPTVEGLVP